jgi:hypothetical protein
MAPGSLEVPALPPLPAELLERHRAAHRHLAERVDGADPIVRAAFSRLSRRQLVDSLAHLGPTWCDSRRPLLVPAPRGFLSPGLVARRSGASAAFAHLDSRLAMASMGLIDQVLTSSSAEVVNAFVQRSSTPGTETNPGLVRATPTNWQPEANPFEHPPSAQCAGLLTAALELAGRAPAPGIARAGWLAFTIMTIHPFVDGNGRTGRACALAIASADVPLRVDWALPEVWELDREGYVTALQAGQQAPAYGPDRVDPLPFMVHTAASSIHGAGVSLQRVAVFHAIIGSLRDRGLGDPAAWLVATVAADRFVTTTELESEVGATGDDHSDLVGMIGELVSAGFLSWSDPPVGLVERGGGVVLGPSAADIQRLVATVRLGDEVG